MIDEVLAEARHHAATAGGHRLRSRPRIVYRGARGGFGDAGPGAGADLPVLPVSDLRALADAGAAPDSPGRPVAGAGCVLACMDARMGEVYWARIAVDAEDAATA